MYRTFKHIRITYYIDLNCAGQPRISEKNRSTSPLFELGLYKSFTRNISSFHYCSLLFQRFMQTDENDKNKNKNKIRKEATTITKLDKYYVAHL